MSWLPSVLSWATDVLALGTLPTCSQNRTFIAGRPFATGQDRIVLLTIPIHRQQVASRMLSVGCNTLRLIPCNSTLSHTLHRVKTATLLPNSNSWTSLASLNRCLHPNCSDPACLSTSPGQPFRLQLLQAFASRSKDPDQALSSFLQAGVPAGILQSIPSSMQWQQRQSDLLDDDLDGVHLLHCQGNWTQAENNPQLLAELLDKEIQAGWVAPFAGNADAADARWPQGTAISKLNIVTADEKEPRLVLDSTICNANTLCRVPERVSLPSALDVRRTFQHADPYGSSIGLSLDFKAAHKSVKVSEHEHGCLLFRAQQRLYHYVVLSLWGKIQCLLVAASRGTNPAHPTRTPSQAQSQSMALRRRPTGHASAQLLGRTEHHHSVLSRCLARAHQLAQSTAWQLHHVVRVDISP